MYYFILNIFQTIAGEAERFIVDMSVVIRDNLQDSRSIAIKLFGKGKLIESQLEELTAAESCPRTHIMKMLKMVIKNRCGNVFLSLISQSQPDFMRNLMTIRDYETNSQTLGISGWLFFDSSLSIKK